MAWHCLKIIWWLFVAIVPVVVNRFAKQTLVEIGCAPGDCYLPGAQAAGNLFVLTYVFYCFMWPVCAWHVAWLSCELVRLIKEKRLRSTLS